MSEVELNDILADVGLWFLVDETEYFVREFADHGVALYVKVFLEENRYPAEVVRCGDLSMLIINRKWSFQ